MTTCPVAHDYDPLDRRSSGIPTRSSPGMRDEGPVFYLPELDHYIVTRYDDIERVLSTVRPGRRPTRPRP